MYIRVCVRVRVPFIPCVYACLCVCVCVCVLLSLHSLYQCTFRLYCTLCAAFGVINDDDDDDDDNTTHRSRPPRSVPW